MKKLFKALTALLLFNFLVCLPIDNDEDVFPDLKYLNESIDPCDDFYEFSCGNYKNIHPLPDGKKIWDNYYILQEEIENKLTDILKHSKRDDDPSAVKKVKDMFKACMTYDKYDTYYNVRPIKEEFDKFGGWPLLSSSYKKHAKFSWDEVADIVAEYGLPLFVSYQINQNLQDADEFMLNLNKDGLALPSVTSIVSFIEDQQPDMFDDLIRKPTTRKQIPYVNYLNQIATAICRIDNECDVDPGTISRDINSVLSLMQQISQSPNYPVKERAYNKSIENIRDLQDWTDSTVHNSHTKINWLSFFKRSFKNSDAVITNDTKIYLGNNMSIANILELVEDTDQVLLKNFIFARLATFMAPDSSDEMWEAFNNLYRQQYGNKYPIYDVRQDYCKRKILDSQMMFALSHEYSKYFFDDKKIGETDKMVKSLNKSFKDMLSEKEWIDKDGKKNSQKKLQKMVELLGFPEFVYKPKKLDRYYNNLRVCSYDHFKNMQRLRSFGFAQNVGVIGNKRDRSTWTQSPLRVNAFYTPQQNRITIPAAIMNQPFFTGKYSVVDYARIASILGHEITHGFDSNGMLMDSYGNYNPIYSKNVSLVFNQKANCFKEQYSSYYIEEIKQYVNGQYTLRENIADNGGIREAYRAFLKISNKEKKSLHIKSYNEKQLFFIAFATNYCRIYTTEALETMQVTDNHTPNMYRVRGIVSNSEEFAEAFNCPKGSKMNPVDKCVLW